VLPIQVRYFTAMPWSFNINATTWGCIKCLPHTVDLDHYRYPVGIICWSSCACAKKNEIYITTILWFTHNGFFPHLCMVSQIEWLSMSKFESGCTIICVSGLAI
jgi:hypothetical protein